MDMSNEENQNAEEKIRLAFKEKDWKTRLLGSKTFASNP
jgi:hypothetical protein